MILIIARILAITLSALAITKTYHDYHRGKEGITMAAFWIIIWLVILAAAINPNLFNLFIMKSKGQGVGVGTFIGIVLVFLLYLIYRIYEKAHRLEIQIQELVAKLGLKDIDKG